MISKAEEIEEPKVKGGKEDGEAKEKIESRLKFLARMYEAKKAKQAEEETKAEDG